MFTIKVPFTEVDPGFKWEGGHTWIQHTQLLSFFHLLVNVFSVIIITINFKNFSKVNLDGITLCSIGSYFPEVGAFGTLIMPTNVFLIIICKTLRAA